MSAHFVIDFRCPSTVLIVSMCQMEQNDGVSFAGEDRNDAIVQEVLRQLPESDAKIIRFRFGLDGGPLHTLAETEVKFDVSRDALRKLEAATLVKLRIAQGPEPPRPTDNDA